MTPDPQANRVAAPSAEQVTAVSPAASRPAARSRQSILARGAEVIAIEAAALNVLANTLGDSFSAACEAIARTTGRVVVTGMGKSGHIGRKVAATLAATGTPATYLHPADAAHGDLGMIVERDLLLVISNSGNTPELLSVMKYARQVGVPIVGIASRSNSLVMDFADVRIHLPASREACPSNIAPTTSTTLQLALGDALALAVMDMRGFTRESMSALHPGGSIGLRMRPLRDIMHGRASLPLAAETTSMREVISIMTSIGFGIAGITDARGTLVGVITDGDLRRHFSSLLSATAADVMTRTPRTLSASMLAEDALLVLSDEGISAAFVFDEDDAYALPGPAGIVHIHDFLRVGLG